MLVLPKIFVTVWEIHFTILYLNVGRCNTNTKSLIWVENVFTASILWMLCTFGVGKTILRCAALHSYKAQNEREQPICATLWLGCSHGSGSGRSHKTTIHSIHITHIRIQKMHSTCSYQMYWEYVKWYQTYSIRMRTLYNLSGFINLQWEKHIKFAIYSCKATDCF